MKLIETKKSIVKQKQRDYFTIVIEVMTEGARKCLEVSTITSIVIFFLGINKRAAKKMAVLLIAL